MLRKRFKEQFVCETGANGEAHAHDVGVRHCVEDREAALTREPGRERIAHPGIFEAGLMGAAGGYHQGRVADVCDFAAVWGHWANCSRRLRARRECGIGHIFELWYEQAIGIGGLVWQARGMGAIVRKSSRTRISMKLRTVGMVAALFLLVPAGTARAQAPAQNPTPASAATDGVDLDSLRAKADAGDAQAQFDLGTYYFRSRYVTLGYAEALDWFRKSAAQGFAAAQDQLGSMLQNNAGLPQNYKEAVNYYRLAANKGYALAEYHLAGMYKAGLSVHRDYKQAFSWYSKAAEQNLPDAEEELGYFYQSGLGVKRDYAQAIAWYTRAAGHGDPDAENQLGFMAGEGWGQPQDYGVALSWYYKAAAHGSDEAQENIGYIFQHGTGVTLDYAQAMSWFERAAAQGNGDAENQIGWMYQFAQGAQEDDSRALSWYQLSANRGNINGQRNLETLTANLDEDGDTQNATQPVHDPAYEQAEHWADIQNLQRQIDAVEADAAYQDDLVSQLKHMDKGKTDGVSKMFKAMGDVGAVKYQVLAQKDRDEAARLRDQLARITN